MYVDLILNVQKLISLQNLSQLSTISGPSCSCQTTLTKISNSIFQFFQDWELAQNQLDTIQLDSAGLFSNSWPSGLVYRTQVLVLSENQNVGSIPGSGTCVLEQDT